jgi:hypothetical protein
VIGVDYVYKIASEHVDRFPGRLTMIAIDPGIQIGAEAPFSGIWRTIMVRERPLISLISRTRMPS